VPDRTDRSALPAVKTDRADIRHLLAHIRFGRALLQHFGRPRDDEAADAYRAWQDRSRELLRFVLIADELYEAQLRGVYRRMCLRHLIHARDPSRELEIDLGDLESVAHRLGTRGRLLDAQSGRTAERKVLVVHGRNHELRERVARFLMKLGLEPILLEEEAALGRTLIEKLDSQAALFAVVVLTGDDVGALAADADRLRPRARQNVIFELGFSVGRLGRDRVCTLYEDPVELPSDIHGVEYTPIDPAGAWRTKLARELHEAGFRFDPLKLID